MIRIIVVMGVSLCVALACSLAVAKTNASQPSLVGTWVCKEIQAYLHKGTVKTTGEIRITEQNGRFLRGLSVWRHSEKQKPLMDAGGKVSSEAKEPLVGVIGHTGKKVYFVEHDDKGHFHITLTDPDTMEIIYMESGSAATAACAKCTRKK